MKKTKIILPIVGLGATAAATMPMLVSCGSNNVITGDKLFIPTEKIAHIKDPITTSVANQTYADRIASNPNIFIQDWMYDTSYKASWLKEKKKDTEWAPTPDFAITGKFKNVKVEKKQFPDGNQGMLISYELDGQLKVDGNGGFVVQPGHDDEYGYTIREVDLDFNAKVVKYPFLVGRSDGSKPYVIKNTSWNLYSKSGVLDQDIDWNWSVDITADGYYYGEAENEAFIFDDNRYQYDNSHHLPNTAGERWTKESYLWYTYDNLYGTIDYLYHFQNVDHTD